MTFCHIHQYVLQNDFLILRLRPNPFPVSLRLSWSLGRALTSRQVQDFKGAFKQLPKW
jgi:hypothetical protein